MKTVFEPGYYMTVELRLKDLSTLEVTKKALAELASKSLAEPGCSIFLGQYDVKTPTRIIFWERFDDEAAFNSHLAQAHTKAFTALGLTEFVHAHVTSIT